jgi:hypothetical protein
VDVAGIRERQISEAGWDDFHRQRVKYSFRNRHSLD